MSTGMRIRAALPALPIFLAVLSAGAGLPTAISAAEASVSSPDAPSVSIRFRDRTTVDGPSIRLGDIARIMTGEERVVARLETLVVAQAAAFGLTRVLDTEMLFARHLQPLTVRDGRGGPSGGLSIDAERKTIRVTTRSAILPPEALGKAVDAFLAGQPRREGEAWKWELARAPAVVKVPATPYSLDLSFAGKRRKGKVDLNLAIRSNPEARVLRNLSLTVNLRVEEPVLVARRTIRRDEPLDESNAVLEMRETTQMSEMAMTSDPSRLLGRLAKATIPQGRIITPLLVAMAPAVRRGQEARLVYKSGDVNIITAAICRQDGVPGQVITAKSLVTQRLMRVRVTENGSLEPIPGG